MAAQTTQGLLQSFLLAGKIENKERERKIERLGELFTWLGILLGILVVQLPAGENFRQPVYILAGGLAMFSIVWYRLIPKKFSGRTKTFIYNLLTVLFIFGVIHYTGGVQSYLVFLYFLNALAVSMGMPLLHTISIVLFSSSLIFLEVFFTPGSIDRNFALGFLNIWGLLIISFFGRAHSGEAAVAKEREEEILLEKEKTLGRVKDEYVFLISGRLKEPAVTISGFIKTIFSKYSGELQSENKDLLNQAGVNSGRLLKLLDDLLNVSEIEKGSLEINLSDVSLKPIVGEVLSTLFFEAHNKQITLNQVQETEVAVKADPDRLKEVLTNLIGNAIKYTPKGGQVTIEVVNEGDYAKIVVKDNGIGISPNDQQHLFEKFYRVESDKTKSIKGSGLGLFITKNLVEKMGGRMGFQSAPGSGSIFYFTLPRYRW